MKEVKKISPGEARFFPLFKRAYIPYYKYSSHSESSWNDVEYMKKKIIGSIADRDSVTKSFKKQEKTWKNDLKRY